MCDFHFSLSDALFATRLSAGLKILKVFLKFLKVVICGTRLQKFVIMGKKQHQKDKL